LWPELYQSAGPSLTGRRTLHYLAVNDQGENVMTNYRPRRQSSRWLDGDCPAGVLALYDDKRFGDRYTVLYAEVLDSSRGPYLWGRGMSERPSDPQGIGVSFDIPAHRAREYRYAARNRATRWSDLPATVKDCIRADLAFNDQGGK